MTKDVVIQPSRPSEVAKQFKELHYPTLLNFQNEWLSWDGAGAYQSIEDATIESRVSEFLKSAKIKVVKGGDIVLVPFFPKPKDISEVCAMLKHDCHVPLNTMSPPVWLDGTPAKYAGLDPRNIIAFQNG